MVNIQKVWFKLSEYTCPLLWATVFFFMVYTLHYVWENNIQEKGANVPINDHSNNIMLKTE